MNPEIQPASSPSPLNARLTRRSLLRMGGFRAVGAAGLEPLLGDLGTGRSSLAPAAPTVQPAGGVQTVASAQPAAGMAVPGPFNVKAHELDTNMIFDVSRVAIPAGTVSFRFSNTGRIQHSLCVYPTQDISKLMTVKRSGKTADVAEFIKGIAASSLDIDAGKTATIDATLTPGFYELACFMSGLDANGATFVHFDRGQAVTLAVTGDGGPSASVMTPSTTISVEMCPGTGDRKDAWLFVPDHLIAQTGKVTFNITNRMRVANDFAVYPLGDISAFASDRLAGGEDYGLIDGELLARDIAPGESATTTTVLTPGWWVAASFLVTRLPDGTPVLNRDRGQRFTFLVA